MNERQPFLTTPKAVLFAGLLIAAALIFVNLDPAPQHDMDDGLPAIKTVALSDATMLRDVTAEDHIWGDPAAPISIIEFSDFQCPYCARLHPTLKRVVAEASDVNWVYRHFPLASHGEAFDASLATECAAAQGGHDAFWSMTDALFENQRRISDAYIESLAVEAGLDLEAFRACQRDPVMSTRVHEDLDEIVGLGGGSTPSVVIRAASGEYLATASGDAVGIIPGALEYENWMKIIEIARTY